MRQSHKISSPVMAINQSNQNPCPMYKPYPGSALHSRATAGTSPPPSSSLPLHHLSPNLSPNLSPRPEPTPIRRGGAGRLMPAYMHACTAEDELG
jgi:hypothetical protein